MRDAARRYLSAGLCVLPAFAKQKRPAVRSWKQYQSRLPTEDEIEAWFAGGPDGLCLLTGAASGNLELLDFDFGGELFDPWSRKVEAAAPGLLDRLVVETSQSGGWHVVYRCEGEIGGNMKLAQRPGDDGRLVTLIETRGEGGLFLCAPTPGYELVQGDLADPPVLSETERETLLQAAWGLNEYSPKSGPSSPTCGTSPATARSEAEGWEPLPAAARGWPGDDFNARGDVAALLRRHGWRSCGQRADGNQHWTRPGKPPGHTSATLKDRTFYVFSSNAAPFEPDQAYSPFAVYALLEHNGDYEAAARALSADGFGQSPPSATDADISQLVGMSVGQSGLSADISDPGPTPADLLRVPGFVGEVMDYCLETAPYPNPVMAFCGALAFQAFLAGRKVRDSGDNRTNIYLLGLAHSAASKDWPRRINTRIAHEAGLADCLGDRFASGEGVQDALFANPTMLFQTDEIDGLLQSINRSKDARHENLMGTLLTLHSASASVFPMRPKAGKESPGVIDQPCLVIFGTAIPNHYYEALSERMLTNGFFARMIILEAGRRGKGQEPSIRDVPPRVIATAKWWADFQPGQGNLKNWHPVPVVVDQTEAAKEAIVATREEAEAEYAQAEDRGDPVGTTVWGRVSEQTRKLALLYAISEDHQHPQIGKDAVSWASRLVVHQTQRMLAMAEGHVAENPFHAECLKAIQKLSDAPDHRLPHSVLLKRMKIKAKDFREMIETLVQRGDIGVDTTPRAGSAVIVYQLKEGVKPG